RPERARPSGLAEHEAAGGRGLGRAAAMFKGSAVHRLLEVLPDRQGSQRPELARRLLAAEFAGLDPALAAAALAEVEAVLAAPWAAELFGPDSLAEATVALAPPEPGAAPMLGRIDRLVLRPAEVLVVDYKTDAAPPVRAEEAPAAYLAQLGAYRAGLAALYPGRRVTAAILWTASPSLMPLPEPAGGA
ncbi:MAG TPA: PD-(D/E)XK nuclease family protein, partial [Thermohalobaculum sp.]|nr:PD-(D/E)XK nuclease family protein [Thermohalobaculum sp.]